MTTKPHQEYKKLAGFPPKAQPPGPKQVTEDKTANMYPIETADSLPAEIPQLTQLEQDSAS